MLVNSDKDLRLQFKIQASILVLHNASQFMWAKIIIARCPFVGLLRLLIFSSVDIDPEGEFR